MGEIAEMMLDGTLCQQCGTYIGNDSGFPEYCKDCEKENFRENLKPDSYSDKEITELIEFTKQGLPKAAIQKKWDGRRSWRSISNQLTRLKKQGLI